MYIAIHTQIVWYPVCIDIFLRPGSTLVVLSSRRETSFESLIDFQALKAAVGMGSRQFGSGLMPWQVHCPTVTLGWVLSEADEARST